jgi:hypothetical protein
VSFKFNPFTGTLDIAGSSSAPVATKNFSYLFIPTGQTIRVAEGQQMVFDGDLVVDGTLEIDGQILQLVDYSFWAYSWNLIPVDVSLLVPTFRDMLVVPGLIVDGVLTIDGRLVEVD